MQHNAILKKLKTTESETQKFELDDLIKELNRLFQFGDGLDKTVEVVDNSQGTEQHAQPHILIRASSQHTTKLKLLFELMKVNNVNCELQNINFNANFPERIVVNASLTQLILALKKITNKKQLLEGKYNNVFSQPASREEKIVPQKNVVFPKAKPLPEKIDLSNYSSGCQRALGNYIAIREGQSQLLTALRAETFQGRKDKDAAYPYMVLAACSQGEKIKPYLEVANTLNSKALEEFFAAAKENDLFDEDTLNAFKSFFNKNQAQTLHSEMTKSNTRTFQ